MSDLDRLASRAAIQDLYSDKLIAVDKRQEGRLASIWWDDAEWTIEGIGTYKGPEGALDLANNVLWPMFHECIHYGTNLRWEFVSADKVNGIGDVLRSEEHTSELQSLMRISYAVFCLKKKTKK